MLLFLVLSTIGVASAAGENIVITTKFDPEYADFKIYLGPEQWFRSGELKLRHNGQWWSTASKNDYSLTLTEDVEEERGADDIGHYSKRRYVYGGYINSSTASSLKVETSVLTYSNPPVVVFEVVYVTGLTNASDPKTSSNGILSTFPSFYVEQGPEDKEKGWMTWSGNMAAVLQFGKWSSTDDVYGSVQGGFPLVVFDSDMKMAVVMSPLNTFTSANQATFLSTEDQQKLVSFGPLASIDKIPAGYKYSTIMVGGDKVTSAMKLYGRVMRAVYQKPDSYRKADFSINYLGYWTDNGACYYYYTGKYGDYEKVLVAVKEDADSKGLPFRYMQLDSWWYFKGIGGGVKNWTADPKVFPNGIQSVVNKTGWPVVAHNRYWSPDTDYAKKFKFIVEDKAALPDDPTFWDYLISSSLQSWKMIVYEQDWLDSETSKMHVLTTELNLGERWLMDMGASAQRYGITIQYCMPWPRHVVQSVMVPTVTQIRVSHDYGPGNSQWIVGDTTILAHAVGLAAFKDTFRTSSDQESCASKYHTNETAPTLETYVAALSGGPVGPGDMVGTADATLIMTTCMKDGRLLKPTHPAMSLDSTFLRRALGNTGPKGVMTAAFTEIGYNVTWYYVMAAELEEDYALTGSELPPSKTTDPSDFMHHVAFQYDVGTGKVLAIKDIGPDRAITVEKCGKEDFKYFVIAPLLDNGMALFGELNKFVTISETRFSRLSQNDKEASITVTGVPSERVKVTVYNGKTTLAVDCLIGDGGSAELTLSATPTCL